MNEAFIVLPGVGRRLDLGNFERSVVCASRVSTPRHCSSSRDAGTLQSEVSRSTTSSVICGLCPGRSASLSA